jgi:hypothetical protein
MDVFRSNREDPPTPTKSNFPGSHPISDTVQDIGKRESEYRVAQEARLKAQEDKIRLEKTLRMEQEIRTASEAAKARLERGRFDFLVICGNEWVELQVEQEARINSESAKRHLDKELGLQREARSLADKGKDHVFLSFSQFFNLFLSLKMI